MTTRARERLFVLHSELFLIQCYFRKQIHDILSIVIFNTFNRGNANVYK